MYDTYPDIKSKILLENTAGQGSSIGHKFSQLKDIYEMINHKDKIGFCVDTAHLWAAGYDFVNNYNDVFNEIYSTLGFDNIKLFHLNDSKTPLGSRVDRHEHIGKGKIDLQGFKLLLNDARFIHIPKVIETPKSKDQVEDIENLKILNGLIEN